MDKRKCRKVENLLCEYRKYLRDCRGASEGTCREYISHVQYFLKIQCKGGIVDIGRTGPGDIISFVTRRRNHYKPKTIKLVASALRSFLRYLQIKGLCEQRLINAVPTIPFWRLATLPRALSEEQFSTLLKSFDSSKPLGRRGYAIIQCLAGLGLRADEVAHLCLADINWREGVVNIRQKKLRRVDQLPLPNKVGEALADYLRNGRPLTNRPEIFLGHNKRFRGMPLSSSAIRRMVRWTFHRAGIEGISAGTHTLRHTVATRMVRGGISLKEIADVLRHRHLDTTMIYAKVDVDGLREVAMPWPEVS